MADTRPGLRPRRPRRARKPVVGTQYSLVPPRAFAGLATWALYGPMVPAPYRVLRGRGQDRWAN